MILQEELQVCVDQPDVFPLLRLALQGAAATISAPGGTRVHVIVETREFPQVVIAINRGEVGSVRRNLFLHQGFYDGVEWNLVSEEFEARVCGIFHRKGVERAERLAEARAELARRDEELHQQRVKFEAERTEEARKESLDRLIALYRERPDRINWGKVLRDLSIVRDLIRRSGDFEFIDDIYERHRKSWGFLFSADQVQWLNDILGRLVRFSAQ